MEVEADMTIAVSPESRQLLRVRTRLTDTFVYHRSRVTGGYGGRGGGKY